MCAFELFFKILFDFNTRGVCMTFPVNVFWMIFSRVWWRTHDESKRNLMRSHSERIDV